MESISKNISISVFNQHCEIEEEFYDEALDMTKSVSVDIYDYEINALIISLQKIRDHWNSLKEGNSNDI